MFSITYGPTRILLIIAILPAIAMLLFVYYRDKKEKEPKKFIALLMGMGAGTIIPAGIIESVGALLLQNANLSENAYYWIYCFCIIGVAEELGKFLVCIIPTWKSKEFKHSYDGIVYAVSASLGFAVLENIGYVAMGGVATGIIRAFTAIPIHCTLGVIMGYLYAKAREAAYKNDSGTTIAYMIFAYLFPVIIHGMYDFFAMTGETGMIILILVCAYATAIFLILYCSNHDHRIDGLPESADYGVYGKEYRGFGNRRGYQNNGYYQNQYNGANQNNYNQNMYGNYGQSYGYNQNNNYSQNQYGNFNYQNQYNSYGQNYGYFQNQYNNGTQNNYNQNTYGNYEQSYNYNQNTTWNQSQYGNYEQNNVYGQNRYSGGNQNNGYSQNQYNSGNTEYRQNPYSSYNQNNYTYNPYRRNTNTDDTTDNQ